MNLISNSSRKRATRRLLVSTALCTLLGCGVLTLTLSMRAQQSSGARALVRHGFVLNGRIEGSVQQLSGEATTLNGNAALTGDLLVPGTPVVVKNGNPTFGGVVQGGGSAQPSNYQITLNGSQAQLGRLITRTDPSALPAVAAPPNATGTRDVTLNNANQNPGDFATLRDLTLNGNVGAVAVPPGTYRRFTANGNSGFVFGVAGSSQPAVYNLNSLVLNGNSKLELAGPVVLTTANGVTLNAAIGSSANPLWLTLKVAAGGVTLNGGGALYGTVLAPSGTVIINGNSSLVGGLACDRLTMNGNALLRLLQQDATPPAVNITQPASGALVNTTSVNVAGAFSDASATAITVNGVAANINGNNFSANVPVNEGQNTLLVVATDAAGNRTEVSRTIVRDTTAPTLSLAQPAQDAVVNSQQVTVTGAFGDATATSVSVNGVAATLNGNSFSASVTLTNEGNNTLLVRATDAAGNQSETTRRVRRDIAAPILNVNSPANGLTTDMVIVSGGVFDIGEVTVTANGTSLLVDETGAFVGQLPLPDGAQQVQIVATDEAGNQTTVTRSVTVDATPPVISELNPDDGAKVDTPAALRGRVTDATQVSVTVNNTPASVAADGLFTLTNFALSEGENELLITATDAAGNVSDAEIILTGRDHTAPQAPSLFHAITPTRLAFQTLEGRAEPGSKVSIAGGAEPATADAAFGTGLFAAHVPLAAGTNNLLVTATDAEGNISGAARVAIVSDPNLPPPPAGQPAQINISTGNTQKGLVSTELPRPLIVIVTDRDGQPVTNAAVRFAVQAGDGQFVGGGVTIDATTDDEGRASARYVSGATPGPQQVSADFPGNVMTRTVFLAEALEATSGGVTSVSGMVLDQNLRTLPNVLVRIGGQETRTATDGSFTAQNVASGPHQLLELIGREQIQLPGRWPNITYDMDVLPGVDNTLGRPLFLPRVNDGVALPLDANNIVTQDTTYEMPVVGGQPSVKVTARAGTHVTFPPDVTDKRLSVTRIATNRVPMTLEDGRATNLYISVQPSGAIFETPLEVTFPNLDNLPAGGEALLMSFDHDAGRYISVGTAHVSGDGKSVKSDPGSGIRVGAWHATPPVPPRPEVTVTGHIQIEGNPAFADRVATDENAWVEGTRAVLSTGGAALDEAARLDYRAVLALPAGAGAVPAKMEAKVKAVKITVTMTAANGATRIPSVQAASRVDHYVTPKAAGNARITATINPDTPATRKLIKWTGATQDGMNSLQATVPIATSRRQIVQIKARTKVLKEVRVWVVWANLASVTNPPDVIPFNQAIGGAPLATIGTRIQVNFSCTATITPRFIFTNSDRPDLAGGNTAAAPGGNNAQGMPLAGGASSKWDMSRRISRVMNVNAANPMLALPALDVDIPFPPDLAVGNDDAGTGDENNNPYPSGKLRSVDTPSRLFELQGGNVGSTYSNLTLFEEFARLELMGTWHVISDPRPWSVSFQFSKVQVTEAFWNIDANGDGDMNDNVTEAMLGIDTNGDGDMNDDVGYWSDDGSFSFN